MKKLLPFVSLALACAAIYLAMAEHSKSRAGHTLVILSTNDIHAAIDNFPRLATAVRECRDTADVVLVDAGDRWTGNVFVDRAAEPRRPIIDLMNRLGYDAATLGNHEFDPGQAYLGRMLQLCDFPVVCANVVSDTCTFAQPDPYVIVERGGIRTGFLGVVTNYGRNNHPDGRDECFEGLTFPDPIARASELGDELAAQCDVAVLLSHMGDDKDAEFAEKNPGSPYGFIIGGHTHQLLDKSVNGLHIGQTQKNLQYVGVSVLRFKGRRCVDMEYRNVPLAGYEPDPEFAALVTEIESDTELLAPAGRLAAKVTKTGLAALFCQSAVEATGCEVAFYHRGGIRKDSLEGTVTCADVWNLDPFGSYMHAVGMTYEQMERMIVSKFNDTKNMKESHCIDLFSNVPYVIRTDAEGEAVAVEFPTLQRGRSYKTALCSYVYATYADVVCRMVGFEKVLVTDMMFDWLRAHNPASLSDEPLQSIRPVNTVRDLPKEIDK